MKDQRYIKKQDKMISIEDVKERYRVKNKKLIYTYQEGYIGKKVYEVTLNDGTVKKVEQITKRKNNGDAVVIIPVTKQNKFVIIVEARPATDDEVALSFPAGMVDENEEFEIAAKRELEEETGYTCDRLVELEWHYQDQGCSNAKIRTFVALDCQKVQEQNLDDGERIEPFEMEYEGVKKLVLTNKMCDANSKIAFMTYSLRKNEI